MPCFIRISLLLGLLCAGQPLACGQPHEAGEQSAPDWIWVDRQDAAYDIQFTKSLRLASAPTQASLGVAADSCDVVVQVNGQTVLQLESFAPTSWIDVARYCVPGDNEFALIARPHGQPPAIALSFETLDTQGKASCWRSDSSWTAKAVGIQPAPKIETRSLGQVAKPMWGIGARPAKVSPFEDYTQWKRALGEPKTSDSGRFWTRKGFEIELIQNAAADQGSWVALAFDQDGRLTIAREERGLLRFWFDRPGGKISRMETLDDELLECRGLAYVNGDLYANANNSKALYRLSHLNGESVAQVSEVVREFPGGVGHGRNQLAVHGGALWSICGDAVDLPTDMFDRTSPFREARQGRTSREGFLARFDLQSRQWQLFCAGLRNPFGVAFHKDGEAFTYDADAEYDMGAPWYRPTRLLHLRSGADYGWRGVTGSWPPYDPDHPDNAQPLLDIGKGSPTAVAFGYASNFPSAFRDALYVLDWAYGRVLAVHLSPRGGSYRAQAETFLQGAPLNVTGIAFGPDGAMYLTTGGRKTKSALYRVRSVGPSAEEPPASLHRLQMKEQALAAVALRRQLETWHGRADLEDLEWAFQHLGSRDPSIRNAAQTALEHQPLDAWRNIVLDAEPSRSAMVGLLSLARSDANELARPVVQRLLQYEFAALDIAGQLTLLQTLTRCMNAAPQLRDEFRPSLLVQLDAHFPKGNDEALGVGPYGTTIEVNRELARMLIDLEAAGIVDRCVAELQRSTAQEDRLHYLFLLANVKSGWSAKTHLAYFTALREADEFVAGEGMPKFLQLIREAAMSRLDDPQRASMTELLERRARQQSPAVVNRPLVSKWTLAELSEAIAASEHQPSAVRGATIFQEALCVQCHRVGARGPAVGPDLTYVGRRFSQLDILDSIVSPNKVVAENYRNLQVVTTDGRVLIGRPLTGGDYRSPTIRIAVNPLQPNEIVELSKQDIESTQMIETSPMPANLLNTFDVEEIIDLLEYVSRGDR